MIQSTIVPDRRVRQAVRLIAICLGLLATIALLLASSSRVEFVWCVGAISILFGASLLTRWQRFGAWLSLSVLGQAASLQLIEAGKACWYQHYLRPLDRMLFWPHSLYLTIVCLQAALVIWGLSRWRTQVLFWIRESFTWWQVLAAAMFFTLPSATVSAYLPHYGVELLFATGVQAIGLGGIVLCTLSLPPDAANRTTTWLYRALAADDCGRVQRATGIHPWVWAMAVGSFVVSAAMNWWAYERHPHVNDEAICLYQARYFAMGLAYLSPPPVPAAFELDHMYLHNGKWFGVYSPGWPSVLAPATLLGMAGLVNPFLNGLNVVLAYLFVKRLYGVAAALATSMLLAVSPWSLFMAMSYMSHTITIALGLGLAIVLSRLHDVFRPVHAASVGMLVGAAVLMRPLDGWVLMLAAGLYLLTLIPRHGVRPLIWVILGGLPFLAVQLGYNSLLTGGATRFPLMAYYDEYHGPGVNTLGFGPTKGRHWPSLDAFPGHSPAESLINANMNLFAINSEMFGWVTGSLWPVILLLLWGRLRQTDVLLILVILINVGVFALYWSSGGPDFGARYWSISLVPLLVLTVRGASELGERLGRVVAVGPPGVIWVVVAMSCLTFMSLIAYLPWRCVDKYYRYLGMHPAVERLASKYEFGESLVLVYGGYFDYLSAAVYNPVNLNAPQPIYAWARDAQVQSEVLRAYADRPVWIVRGSAVAPNGQWTAEGPILPSERARRLPAPPDINTALP